MSLLLLEALGALILFVFMVWWTMFSGRKNGELKGELKSESKDTLKGELNADDTPPQVLPPDEK